MRVIVFIRVLASTALQDVTIDITTTIVKFNINIHWI